MSSDAGAFEAVFENVTVQQTRVCWKRVAAFPRELCALGEAYMTCLGRLRHLVAMSQRDPETLTNEFIKVFRSDDDGRTWFDLHDPGGIAPGFRFTPIPGIPAHNQAVSALVSTGFGVALLGLNGEHI